MIMDMFELFDSNYGNGIYESIPDGTGGADIIHNGSVADHANADGSFESQGDVFFTPNAEGGTDVISEGVVVAHTQPNIEGGVDVYHNTEVVRTTIPNAEGGVNIYNGDMNLEGMTVPNEFGSEDYVALQGNSNEIISYDDPLAYSSQYRMGALIF